MISIYGGKCTLITIPYSRLHSQGVGGKGFTDEAGVERGQYVGGPLLGGIGFTAAAGVERGKTFVHGILNHPMVD